VPPEQFRLPLSLAIAPVSQETIEAPSIKVPDTPPSPDRTRGSAALDLAYSWRWVLGAAALLLISTLLVVWAGTRPGYDPYGWLVWGKLLIHAKLDTNGAPSWKPLPFLFTAPFALVGHYALWLWMVTSVAISLSGFVFAWRIAFRLTDAPPERRYAAYAAGAFAGLTVFGIHDYSHFILSSQSDTMIVSLCLGAIDCQLSGRRRWAFWMWVLAALGRPEVWPFLVLYSVWAWRAIPEMRRMMVWGLVLIPVFWFGIPALTAKSAFIAGSNALNSPRELHSNKVFGTIDRFFKLHEAPLWIAALLATALATYRRQRATLLLAAGAVTWVIVEIAFAVHGWPAVPRYLFEPVAVACVLGGIFVGRVILDLPPMLRRVVPRFSPQATDWATGLLVLLIAGMFVPAARSRLRVERKDLTHEQARAKEINRLSTVVSRLGTSHILACGQPKMPIGYQSILAWYMGIKIGVLYINPDTFALHPHTTVDFFPLHNGWRVLPTNVSAASAPQCHGLRLTFRS
jgi:hypothetical protein